MSDVAVGLEPKWRRSDIIDRTSTGPVRRPSETFGAPIVNFTTWFHLNNWQGPQDYDTTHRPP